MPSGGTGGDRSGLVRRYHRGKGREAACSPLRLPWASQVEQQTRRNLGVQLEKALRPRTLLHVDAALLRLLREPALGISHAAGDNWLVFAAERAIAAGAKEVRPLQDQFYGDRTGTIEDPFGFQWTIATHIEDLTDEEIAERAKGHMG